MWGYSGLQLRIWDFKTFKGLPLPQIDVELLLRAEGLGLWGLVKVP